MKERRAGSTKISTHIRRLQDLDGQVLVHLADNLDRISDCQMGVLRTTGQSALRKEDYTHYKRVLVVKIHIHICRNEFWVCSQDGQRLWPDATRIYASIYIYPSISFIAGIYTCTLPKSSPSPKEKKKKKERAS
jgi:hypothetical protein